MRLPFPKSPIVNFGALILLFATIALLHHFGGRFQSRSGTGDAGPGPGEAAAGRRSIPAMVEDEVAHANNAVAAAPGFPRMPDVYAPPVPMGEPIAKPAGEVGVAAHEPADEAPQPKELAREPTAEKPRMYVARARPGKRPVARRADGWGASERAPSFARRELERIITVEELDGEDARQGYLAESRGTAQGARASAQKPLPAITGGPSGAPSKADFIPFEKRN